jgi:hypothetical protein
MTSTSFVQPLSAPDALADAELETARPASTAVDPDRTLRRSIARSLIHCLDISDPGQIKSGSHRVDDYAYVNGNPALAMQNRTLRKEPQHPPKCGIYARDHDCLATPLKL